jgi:hypothetical protein
MTGSCELGHEPSGSIKAWNFLTTCETIQVFKKGPAHGVTAFYELPNKNTVPMKCGKCALEDITFYLQTFNTRIQ